MSWEIHYTSAPEGLKAGQHGFCTVAATEGIPKALWERLESLSGYRHADGDYSPVSLAHWIVRASGKENHVLSRICDAGQDYTGRSNLFAHHIALEATELAEAGPAWMLQQSGLVATTWDGRVGSLSPAALPRGDQSPAVCSAWQAATGDAGWGGLVAESFAKTPNRQIVIVYAAGQDVLALIAEAIRLLPRSQRWQATFNTYFTSVPTSASCACRCCLAGSRAAAEAVRSASAGGLVIDLTQVARQKPPADGEWVELARTGRRMTATAAPPSAKAVKAPSRKGAFVPTGQAAPLGLADELPPAFADTAPPRRPPLLRSASRRSWVATPASADDEEDLPPPRPWRRLASIYLLACAAIGIGSWLIVRASRSVVPPPPEVTSSHPATSLPANIEPPTPNHIVEIPTTVAAVPETQPTHQQVVVTTTAPTRPVDVVVALPAVITVGVPLQRPSTGTGVRDETQRVPLDARKLDNLKLSSLRVIFPGEAGEYSYKSADLSGTLTPWPQPSQTHPGVVLKWKDAGDPTGGVEMLVIQINTDKPQLEATWKTAAVIRRPEVAALVYWVMENSAIGLGGPLGQRICFAPVEIKPVDMTLASSPLDFPSDPPPGAVWEVARPPSQWTAAMKLVWPDGTGSKLESAATRVIELHRGSPTGDGDLVVTFTLPPGGRTLESDLSARLAAAKALATQAAADLAAVDGQMAEVRKTAEEDIKLNEKNFGDSPTDLKIANDRRRFTLAQDLQPLDAKHKEVAAQKQAADAIVARLHELTAVDLTVRLSDGISLLVLPLRADLH